MNAETRPSRRSRRPSPHVGASVGCGFWTTVTSLLRVSLTTWCLGGLCWTGSDAAQQCTNHFRLTADCLINYFSDTHQEIPSSLMDILNSTNQRTRRHHSTSSVIHHVSFGSHDYQNHDVRWKKIGLETIGKRMGDRWDSETLHFKDLTENVKYRRDVEYEVFEQHWCRSFQNYLGCMETAVESCVPAKYLRCYFLSVFSKNYGEVICNSDLSLLVESGPRTCKDIATEPSKSAGGTASVAIGTITLGIVTIFSIVTTCV